MSKLPLLSYFKNRHSDNMPTVDLFSCAKVQAVQTRKAVECLICLISDYKDLREYSESIR